MPEPDDEERQLRIDQMTVNIEKMRFDMAETQRKAELNQRWENRKFLLQMVLAAAALMGAGVALGNYISRAPSYPPGTVITIPPARP
jgi:hypothetical protein